MLCCDVLCYLSALACASDEPRLNIGEARVYFGLYIGLYNE
jgi:hypothetical protein